MLTLYGFGMKVAKIREAADSLEIKGTPNAARIVLITDTCNELICAINEASEYTASNPPVSQNGEEVMQVKPQTDDAIVEEEGEMNGEPDSGTAP